MAEEKKDLTGAQGAGTPEAPAEPAREAAGEHPDEKRVYTRGGRPKPPPRPPKTKEQLDWEAARKDHFNRTWWQPILRPVVALVSICLVASLLLGLTNMVTEPIINENARLAADAERQALLPEADGFEQTPVPEGMDSVTAIYRATNGAGWVVEAYGRGYGGKVPAMVAFGPNGTVLGVTFMDNSETVGLGQKVTEPAFGAQFAGRPNEPLSLSDIDAITSATISSGAAINAVNAAVAAFNQASGQGTNHVTDPDEVRAFLLPGEALTAITIQAENVQPTAYRSDAGNYILYGEILREGRDMPVVAAVAMNADGKILNLWLDTSGEGESHGALLATDAAYLSGFIGQTAPVQVDTVAGVTGSSNAVTQAVNGALNALPLAKEAA